MKRRPSQPTLLWIYGGAIAVLAVFQTIFFIAAILGALRQGVLPVLPILIGMAWIGYAVAVAYALLDDRWWARELLVMGAGLSALLAVWGMMRSIDVGSNLIELMIAGFTFWYLYSKPNVVEYFEFLRAEAAQDRDGRSVQYHEGISIRG